MTHAGKEALSRIVEGLDGVTPGPWSSNRPDNYVLGYYRTANVRKVVEVVEKRLTNYRADLDHIARCDPDTFRSIAAYVEELENAASRGSVAYFSSRLEEAIEANRKLHRRLQLAEAIKQCAQDYTHVRVLYLG